MVKNYLKLIVALVFATNVMAQSKWDFYNTSNSKISGNYIKSLAVDNNNNLWVGTGNNGVSKYDGNTWTNYTTSNSNIPFDVINCLAVDKNNVIWIGTDYKGLSKFDGTNWITYDKSNCAIADNKILCLLIDPNGNVWIGTNNGLSKFDGANWTTYNKSNSGIASNNISSLAIDSKENIWIGTDFGLNQFDGINWVTYNNTNSKIVSNGIYCLSIDKKDNIYTGVYDNTPMGQDKGLWKFENNTWSNYDTTNSEILYDKIIKLEIDNQQKLWILNGNYGGLTQYDGVKFNNNFNPYPNSISYQVATLSLVSDKLNNIWLGTDVGLFKINMACTSPKASISPQSNTVFCEGDFVNLNATLDTNYSYQWYLNNEPINSANKNQFKANITGNYTVKVSDGACDATSTPVTVTVYPSPKVTLDLLNPFTLKNVAPIQLFANPSGGTFSGEGVQGTTFNPSLVSLGKKLILYKYTSPEGCSGIDTKSTIVVDSIGNICNITKYDTVIVNKTKYDTVTVTNNVTKYDTVKVTKVDTVTFTNNVTKYDTITIKNNVYDTVKVTNFDTVTVTNNVTKYDTVIVKTNVFDTIKVTKYDTLTITNNVTKYDTVSILKIKFKLTTGIHANQLSSLSIYPNPTSDVLHIDVPDAKALEGYRYRILDALGKEVYNQLVTQSTTEIPLKTLGTAGIYQFEILDATKTSIQSNKIVLQ